MKDEKLRKEGLVICVESFWTYKAQNQRIVKKCRNVKVTRRFPKADQD